MGRPAVGWGSGQMAAGQVVVTAHFFQAARGAGEIEGERGGGDIQLAGGRGGGGDQIHVMVVQDIHETNEARRLVLLLIAHPGDIGDKNRMKATGDLDVIDRPLGPVAQSPEVKPGDSVRVAGGRNGSALDLDLPALHHALRPQLA